MKNRLITLQHSFVFFIMLGVQVILNSQTLGSFGIKGGLSLSRISLSEYNEEAFPNQPAVEFKLISMDIGLFAELVNSKQFCVSTELHYRIIGENNDKKFTVIVPEKNGTIETYAEKNVSDRFHYISLQILPRWKYQLNRSNKLYLFAGPRADLRMANSNSESESAIEFENNKLQAGFAAGMGFENSELLSIEIRYEHNLTNAYTITFGNQTFNRKHNSFYVLAGVSFSKLLKTK
jgi:hypothetical protein